MVKPNTLFELNINDIDIIEQALDYHLSRLINNRQTHIESTIVPEHKLDSVKKIDEQIADLRELLGKIHNQKNWYRPKGIYISG